jgi:hypothetical protein
MALNLFVVAAIAPAIGMAWRRRRRDLPRAIATDQAGTVLLGVLLALTVVIGIVHRASLQADDRDRSAAYVATSTYIHNQRPALAGHLTAMDAVEVEEGVWRSCVPSDEAGRFLCLFVNVTQSPAGVTKDLDQLPNSQWQR